MAGADARKHEWACREGQTRALSDQSRVGRGGVCAQEAQLHAAGGSGSEVARPPGRQTPGGQHRNRQDVRLLTRRSEASDVPDCDAGCELSRKALDSLAARPTEVANACLPVGDGRAADVAVRWARESMLASDAGACFAASSGERIDG
jgi:hypothetical protein